MLEYQSDVHYDMFVVANVTFQIYCIYDRCFTVMSVHYTYSMEECNCFFSFEKTTIMNWCTYKGRESNAFTLREKNRWYEVSNINRSRRMEMLWIWNDWMGCHDFLREDLLLQAYSGGMIIETVVVFNPMFPVVLFTETSFWPYNRNSNKAPYDCTVCYMLNTSQNIIVFD